MPKYEFKDLYVPAFDISGSGDKATNEASLPNLTMAYTPIEPTYLLDVFVFTDEIEEASAKDSGLDLIEVKDFPEPSNGLWANDVNARSLETEESSVPIADDVFEF